MNKSKHIGNFFRGLTLSLMSICLTLFIIGGCVLFYMILQLPNIDQLKDVRLQIPLKIYTANNQLIGEFGNKRRTPVTLAQVPQPLIQAVIDTEDKRFYEHSGVDFIGLMRAAKAVFEAGRKTQGASTITMQVARNFFLTPKKTYIRKAREMLLAMKIDHEFSKNEILALYLNKVYFGQRAYGVASAAQVYYGKPLDELTLPEMAMIAGLPQAPSRDNPISNPKAAIKRRNHVLERMLDNSDLDQITYKQAIKASVTAKYHAQKIMVNAPYVAEMVRTTMVNEFGPEAYEDGIKVYTTIDAKMQQAANQSLRNGLIAYDKRHGYRGPEAKLDQQDQTDWQEQLQKMPIINYLQPAAVTAVNNKSIQALLANGQLITINWSGLQWARRQLAGGYVGSQPRQASDIVKIGDVIRIAKQDKQWQLSQVPQVTGALVALNPKNGALLALNGGFSYVINKFNNAIQANRQPGSSFKPFIYSAALDKGFTLASIINDAPIVMADSGANSLWRPQNVTKKFYGPTRLRVGLIKSRNLVSIRLLQDISINYAINYIQRFGFNPDNLPQSLSLALGSATISPLELAAGYAVFANGGYQVTPFLINKVTDENGKILFQAYPATAPTNATQLTGIPNQPATQVITPQNAYLITDALKGVIRQGTGRLALALNRSDLAGKTGTTNNRVDAWFAGFNGDVVATVWVGLKQPATIYEYGAQAALPIWMDFIKNSLQGKAQNSMSRPPGIVTVRIDPKTGLLPYPGQKTAIFEMFRKQNVPQQRASSARQQNINNTTTTNQDDEELF